MSIFVKPWSKSKSGPLSQQAPKLNKSPPKKEKEGFGQRADTKITWATNPTPPNLLTLKRMGIYAWINIYSV